MANHHHYGRFLEGLYGREGQSDPVERKYGSTGGFRQFGELGLDTLPHRTRLHFEAEGRLSDWDQTILPLGANIIQSPLERAMLSFLVFGDYGPHLPPEVVKLVLPGEEPSTSLESAVFIAPQRAMGPYTLDIFMRVNVLESSVRLDVECDGAEFHGSTDAIRHDARRDALRSKQGSARLARRFFSIHCTKRRKSRSKWPTTPQRSTATRNLSGRSLERRNRLRHGTTAGVTGSSTNAQDEGALALRPSLDLRCGRVGSSAEASSATWVRCAGVSRAEQSRSIACRNRLRDTLSTRVSGSADPLRPPNIVVALRLPKPCTLCA